MTADHASPTDSLGDAFDRVGRRLAWVVLLIVIALSGASWWFGFEPGPAIRYGPLIASLVLLGLPHGAVDHLVPARLAATSPPLSMAIVGLVYAGLGGLYLGLWLVAPLPAALLFIAITWFHWGQGDVHALVAFVEARPLKSRARRIGTLVVRGGLPMLVPLVAFPERYRAVIEAWLALFVGEANLAWALTEELRAMLGGGLLLITVATLASGYHATGPTRGWRVDAGETVLLWAYFLVVPPLVAIGVYFTVWHSLRHIFRLAALDEPGASTGTRFKRFAADATPLTLLAIAVLAGFWVVVPITPTSVPGLVALYLVFIAVLTLPHVAVVSWMDARGGLWAERVGRSLTTKAADTGPSDSD